MKNLDFMGMKYTICRLLALLAALSMTVQSFAQASSYVSSAASVNSLDSTDDPQTGAMLTIHKRVDEVNVLFIATDNHGKFVRDLNQTDFSILDDHKPPQSIVNFRRETDLPLHLRLLIDLTRSLHNPFNLNHNAATTSSHP